MKKNLVKAVLAAVLGFSLIFAGCTTGEDGSIELPDGTTITTPSDGDKSDSTDSSTDSEKTDTDSSSTDSEKTDTDSSSTDSEKTDTDSSSTDSGKTDTDSSSTDSEKTDTETTVEEGSVKVTVNVDGSVSCGKCGKTYELKSEAESCTHYVCETCGSTYYSQSDLDACSAHVTVIFTEAEDVTDGNETVTKVIKSGKTVTAPEWTKEGFTLSWLTSEGKEFDFDDELSVADGETSKTVTFTAKWTTAYTVTFKDADGGENADVTVTVTSGETIETGDIPAWTKDHYTLTWTSSVDGVTTDSAITGDVTFTATWTEDTNYTVTFKDADGGENAEVTQKVYEGEKASVPSWTKENYTLTWTSSVEGVTTDSAITGDVTFTAVWTELPKCSNCGAHYATETAAANCSKAEGCPKYGVKTVIALVDSAGKVITDNSYVTVTGSINAKEANGAVTIEYEGVTYKTVKFDSNASAVVTATAGQTITVVGSLPSGKQKCFKVTDSTGTEQTYKLSSKTTALTTYTQSFTSTGTDTITKGDTCSIALIIIE